MGVLPIFRQICLFLIDDRTVLLDNVQIWQGESKNVLGSVVLGSQLVISRDA